VEIEASGSVDGWEEDGLFEMNPFFVPPSILLSFFSFVGMDGRRRQGRQPYPAAEFILENMLSITGTPN
jgi:hypothetical protein